MSKYQTRYNRNLDPKSKASEFENSYETLDTKKLKTVFQKSLIFISLIFILCFALAISYIRYTNVKYRSNSELKLNKRSEATIFGFTSATDESSNLNTLSGEIELIRSKLFLKEVAKNMNLNIKYELIGRLKNEERYKFIPFEFNYDKLCNSISSVIYVEIKNDDIYKISNSLEDDVWQTGSFGQPLEFMGCKIVLKKTQSFFTDQVMKISLLTNEQVLDYLESHLEVAPENLNANTLKISFVDYNPHKVQEIVSTVSNLYTEYSKDQKNQANELKIQFLNSQLEEVENVINNYEAYIESFTLKNKTASPQKDLNFVMEQIIKIDSTITKLQLTKEQVNNYLNQFSEDPAETLNELKITGFDGLASVLKEYNETKKEFELLETRYKAGSQALNNKKIELNLIQTRIKEYLKAYSEFLTESIDQAFKSKERLNQLFSSLPAKSNELNQKMRFYSIYEDLYLSLMQRKTEFQIAKAGTVAEVVILTPASFPTFPIGPSSKILYLGAFILGLIFSLILILIRYFLYDEIISLNELERLTKLPITGTINKVRSSLSKKIGVFVFEKPRSQISENFRSLRTGLKFMGLQKDKQIIAVTSSVSGEGKTFIAVNLAAILSLSNKKTIILDLDMRKPRAQYAFDIENNDQGISAILSGNANWRDCLHTTKNENLHLITSGIIPPNPSELIESNYFNQLLDELKNEYDIIILDTPPIGLISDGITAIKKANHSLFVVRSDYSKRAFIQDLHRMVELNDINNISLVFNASRNTKYSYGYYQDYYDNNLSNSSFSLRRIFSKG